MRIFANSVQGNPQQLPRQSADETVYQLSDTYQYADARKRNQGRDDIFVHESAARFHGLQHEWKKSRWVQQRTTGKSFIGPNDLVFANNEGELRTYTGTKTIFQRLMRQNGLEPYKLHFHSLRHTYSSMLFESRENPKVIQMLLGHKDVTTTIRTYNSVDRSYFKQAVDKLDSKFHFDND